MPPEFHILLIEDSRADVKIIARALAETQTPHRLTVLNDGRQALDYLKTLADPDVADDRQPDLVLLDLNLPGIDGYQVLTQVKGHPLLRAIPVVVLSTSRRDEDILQAYQAGANSFLQKPAEYPLYKEMVKTLHAFWHQTALRPHLRRPQD